MTIARARILLEALEAPGLLGFGDVEPELDQQHALGRQHALEGRDLVEVAVEGRGPPLFENFRLVPSALSVLLLSGCPVGLSRD